MLRGVNTLINGIIVKKKIKKRAMVFKCALHFKREIQVRAFILGIGFGRTAITRKVQFTTLVPGWKLLGGPIG